MSDGASLQIVPPSEEINDILVSRETTKVVSGVKFIDLLKRPQLTYEVLKPIDKNRPDLDPNIFEQVEIEVKYEGYIKRQKAQIEEMRRLEVKKLPENVDYNEMIGLRLEAREKLTKVRPLNIGQASRISGVSPADISVLIIWLSQRRNMNA